MEKEASQPKEAVPQNAQADEKVAEAEAGNEVEPGAEGEGADGEASKPPLPIFNFDFDEKPKKKKKAKKSKKKKVQKSLSREYYEALIPELNSRLADLRKVFTRKDEVNAKLANELATIEEDRVDVCEYLERTLRKRLTQIEELEETLVKLNREYAEYKDYSRERIDELQKLYASVEKQLKGEIELQERALSSLDQYRILRDNALQRFQTTHDNVEEMERQCKEQLFNLEQKNAVQKNVLKKEVGARLHQVAEDFLHSNEIRNASYTRNLIRENITLKKTLDLRVKQNIRIMEEREKQFIKTKEVMESYASLEQFAEHLQHTIDNKSEIINRLTASIERMKTKFIDARRYRNLYDKAMQKDLFKPKESQDFGDINAQLEQLRADKFTLLVLRYLQEAEIQRLREVLNTLMSAVDSAVSTLNNATIDAMGPEEAKALHYSLRKNIIAELLPIISGTMTATEQLENEEIYAEKSTVYRLGSCGFILPKCVCNDEIKTELCASIKCEVKEPIELPASTDSLYGLEFGSYCYYSHTPSVRSSSMLTPIEECSSELETLYATNLGSLIGEKYKQKRCSCPKKKNADVIDNLNTVLIKSSLQFKEPEEFTIGGKGYENHLNKCFGFEGYPYCSDSSKDTSSGQGDKHYKGDRESILTALTVNFETIVDKTATSTSTAKTNC